MINVLLVFLPMFITLVAVVKMQVAKKGYTAAVAAVLIEVFCVLDYCLLEEWALHDGIDSKAFVLLVSVLYSAIVPLFYIFVCKCINVNWKTDRTLGMFLLGLLNFLPSIAVSLDGLPATTPLNYTDIILMRDGEEVLRIYKKDFVMLLQLFWLIYLHVRYFRWMLQKNYHFTIQSKTFYMTLLTFVLVAVLANLVPNEMWKDPYYIWGYFILVSIGLSIGNIMIIEGLLVSPVHDANDEPIIESISEDTRSLGGRVVALIKSERLYCNPNLQLSDVARKVGSNRSYVSKAINDVTGLNFNGYLNRLRTEEALKILAEDKEMKLEMVAEKCGFSSASLFTRVFKKETGLTPSQARRGETPTFDSAENNEE